MYCRMRFQIIGGDHSDEGWSGTGIDFWDLLWYNKRKAFIMI